ncbi:MAG: hypothetical protein QOG77_1384, partial [Solirubrobacteraceae bacterium]|nr:hypothetical protein [Solirubrobacteraceae bacterium]
MARMTPTSPLPAVAGDRSPRR